MYLPYPFDPQAVKPLACPLKTLKRTPSCAGTAAIACDPEPTGHDDRRTHLACGSTKRLMPSGLRASTEKGVHPSLRVARGPTTPKRPRKAQSARPKSENSKHPRW